MIKHICKTCSRKLRMSGFGVQIRPFQDMLSSGYAVVIPFQAKEHALEFTNMLDMFIAEAIDDLPSDAPIGAYGEDMVKTASDILKSASDTDES